MNTREEWLVGAVTALRVRFAERGWKIPKEVRVSCGLPSHGAFNTTKRVGGQTWSSKASKDNHHEIFISPTQDDPDCVLAILTHELVHTVVGIKAGHRGHFIECASAVGLMGPWTSTKANDELARTLRGIKRDLGRYPHGALDGMTTGKKKQKSRLIKVGCAKCGYTTRIAMSWIIVALPVCPNPDCPEQGEPFEVDELPPEE